MKNLIIIGNGFDLAHNLKTSYSDFKKDLTNNSGEYGIPVIHENHLLEAFLNDNQELWSDIETSYYDIISNFGQQGYLQQKYRNVYAYKSIEKLNDDFDKIKSWLCQYLLKVEKQFSPMENYTTLFEEFINEETVVINFNYTSTVKRYLDGKNIPLIQIHGELENEENPIIFGYAANQLDSKKLLGKNDNNFLRNIKKFNYLYTINEITINQHLDSPEYNVFILGHSCGVSDGLILSQIFNNGNIHKIIPFYYKNRHGYFNTMVNIDRIIDDYSKESKESKETKSFEKLLSFPKSHEMPQQETDLNLSLFLKQILGEKLPLEKERHLSAKIYDNYV